jgi:HEAT repeat protein
MTQEKDIPNSSRKLFFGLFVFPLVIAVGMAVLLCTVVLMTHEKETPETLIASIKKSPSNKRWQKAYELSNELNKAPDGPRADAVIREVSQILADPDSYDSKTRGYMALALSHRNTPEAIDALKKALSDPAEDVRVYALWSLGVLDATEAASDVRASLKNGSSEVRKTAAYVLGALGDHASAPELRELLGDPVSDVRWNAALALARLGDASGRQVLIQMTQRQTLSAEEGMDEARIEAVMINAVKGLALIRGAEEVKILESVSRTDKSLRVRQAALDALRSNNQRSGK